MKTNTPDPGAPYAPIGTLKAVTTDVWIVDGPALSFGMRWLKLRFPTRMTVVRLAGEFLFIHSPVALNPQLKSALATLGTPRWIVAPNRIHYWWIPAWHEAYPQASVYLAPRLREQAGERIDFDAFTLDRDDGYPWSEELATIRVVGSYMTEIDFFHRASRTLILADLIENFEPAKLDSLLMRWLIRLGGVQDPDGQMPRDLRSTFWRHKSQLRHAIETMIAWDPQRIILAHGRCYDANGTQELRRAFRWILED